MPEAQANTSSSPDTDVIEIELKNPIVAAIWAWLWPGAGHIYQRRYAKGILFMVCILFTYFFGLAIGGGHVVYASWKKNDRRWHYICQVGVGLPALPALIQAKRASDGKPPLIADVMTPPGDITPTRRDKLADWHEKYHTFFELGTLYTMIAGLLNVLAIYDAYGGPFVPPPPKGSSSKGDGESQPDQRRKRR